MKKVVALILASAGILLLNSCSNDDSKVSSSEHPRIYCSDDSKAELMKSVSEVEWKKQLLEKKKENLEKYILLCEEDSSWLLSRLQMYWKTKHSDVYLKGGDFSHSDGQAPVPTVRFSGTRDWATDYRTPALEDVEPYFDDPRGMFFENKNTGKKEWVKPSQVGHGIEKINRHIMSLVADAAFLYWYTGDEKYAELAAPVFFSYIDGMHYRNPPIVVDNSSQHGISGLATFEVIHEQIVIQLCLAYDFLFDYFQKTNSSLDNTISVFQKWGDQIIKNGIPDNNWNLFQARFLTYIALALDDDASYANGKGQQYYLKNTFEESSVRQIALKESILVYDQENGIWPESPSYSMHVTTTLLEILTLLDNVSDKKEFANFPIIEKAALANFQYLFPNGYSVGWGDSGHGIVSTENCELLIANYRKYNQEEKEARVSALLNQVIDRGDYKRGARDLFKVFFYVDSLSTSETNVDLSNLITPTFYARNVSNFIQRMGEGDRAMMVSTVGSFGNHSHANGIAIELYANNYVLGPDMGRGSSYWHPDFREFYSKLPAHNTVIVDGKSNYHNMRGYHPFTLDNHFPPSGEISPSFDKITFSKVSFVEPETSSDQQRLTALIKMPEGNPYALDIFKSKKKASGAQRHEYFYRNLGQSLELADYQGNGLLLKEAGALGSKYGDIMGYDYFTDKKQASTDKDIAAVFRLRTASRPDNLMKLWIKGSKNQTVFSVMSPKSNALSKISDQSRGTAPVELRKEKIPTLILRRNQEAWQNPFVVVYNPYMEDGENPISTVDFVEESGGYDSQMLRVKHSDGLTEDFIVANSTENDMAVHDGFYQKGVLSVCRLKSNRTNPDFIFLSGVLQYKYRGWEITSTSEALTLSVEQVEGGLKVCNDRPVVIKIPKSEGFNPSVLKIFENGECVLERKGIISRSDPNQIEFRLPEAYENAFIF